MPHKWVVSYRARSWVSCVVRKGLAFTAITNFWIKCWRFNFFSFFGYYLQIFIGLIEFLFVNVVENPIK